MSSYHVINIQQQQLYDIIKSISDVTIDLRDNISVFTFINIIQLQIYILSIPKNKICDIDFSPLVNCLIIMNNDKEEIKKSYSIINIYSVHNILTVQNFYSIVDSIKLTSINFNDLCLKNNQLQEKCNSLLSILENTSIKHKKSLDKISNDYNDKINELQINEQLNSKLMSHLKQQIEDYRNEFRNKEDKYNNLIKSLQMDKDNITYKNYDLKNKVELLQANNDNMKIVIFILSFSIILNILYRLIIQKRSNRKYKNKNIKNK